MGRKRVYIARQAYLDGTSDHLYYQAMAICTQDKVDESEWQLAEVRWEIPDDYVPGDMREDSACDWDRPEYVKKIGGYNIVDKRFG